MNRVYVVQENNYANYSDAERFGELVFMTVDEYKPIRSSLVNEQIIASLIGHMVKFTKDDFLILTGNPTMIGFAFHLALCAVEHSGVNVLQWDKMANSYKPFNFYHNSTLK